MRRLSRQKKGPQISRAGKIKGSKVSLVVDETGLPDDVDVDKAGRDDRHACRSILKRVPKGSYVAADKGYDAKWFRRFLRSLGLRPIIPRRQYKNSPKRRTPKPYLYKKRWTIERTFAWLGKFKKLAIRYERYVDNWKAFWQLGCSLLILQKLTG